MVRRNSAVYGGNLPIQETVDLRGGKSAKYFFGAVDIVWRGSRVQNRLPENFSTILKILQAPRDVLKTNVYIFKEDDFMENIYSEDVMKALRQSLGCKDKNDTSKDEAIMSMDKEEIFERYCQWNGLLGGWYQWLIEAIESIYDVKLEN